jgi:hypothetical protein
LQLGTGLGRDGAVFSTYLDPNQGTLQRNTRSIVIHVVAALHQPFFRTLLSPCCSFEVDFMSTLSGLGEDPHLIR